MVEMLKNEIFVFVEIPKLSWLVCASNTMRSIILTDFVNIA